ncbi:DUF2179 domain-containing protein, partial [Bacillus sp. RO3]|nr:DUF2179 domain-containing protein [Bacillus sp. RO3]
FAYSFLQIPGHPGHPCLQLTATTTFTVRDLNPKACAHAGHTKEVITTILGRKDFSRLKSYIQMTDEKAFITVHRMNEIWGNNFKSFA